MKYFFLLIFLISALSGEENVYDRFFQKKNKTIYNDTMFERVIWYKKVSFLVLEAKEDKFYVTMLVIPESPYNYKGNTYPLRYPFQSYKEAFDKFIWLDKFLKNKGILKVKISGSDIINQYILRDGAG